MLRQAPVPRPLALLQLQPMILLYCLCNDYQSPGILQPFLDQSTQHLAGRVQGKCWTLVPRKISGLYVPENHSYVEGSGWTCCKDPHAGELIKLLQKEQMIHPCLVSVVLRSLSSSDLMFWLLGVCSPPACLSFRELRDWSLWAS